MSEIDPMLHMVPDDQFDRILSLGADIDAEFLGFTSIYLSLSAIIPKHWTVIDLGCAYAPQAFAFTKHRQYVGVDLGDVEKRFAAGNTAHFQMPITEFIARYRGDYDADRTFAICSYVPNWKADNLEATRNAFKNVFTFYPARDLNEKHIPTRLYAQP